MADDLVLNISFIQPKKRQKKSGDVNGSAPAAEQSSLAKPLFSPGLLPANPQGSSNYRAASMHQSQLSATHSLSNYQPRGLKTASADREKNANSTAASEANMNKVGVKFSFDQSVATQNKSKPFQMKRSSSDTSNTLLSSVKQSFSEQKRQLTSSLFTRNPTVSIPQASLKFDYKPSNALSSDDVHSSNLHPLLRQHLERLEFTKLTPIQKQSLPVIMDGNLRNRDVVIQSETGSGKTYSYLLPIVDTLLRLEGESHRDQGTFALILCPTRELGRQVFKVAQDLLTLSYPNRWIVAGALSGGEKKKSEKARLRKGLTLLVGTPGRCLDHLKTTKSFSVAACRWIVIDEVDWMLSMGMEECVKEIVSLVDERARDKPQLIVCSATAGEKLKWDRLNDPIFVSLQRSKSADYADDNNVAEDALKSDMDSFNNQPVKQEPVVNEDAEKATPSSDNLATNESNFTIPNQVKQSALVVPAKLRLVTLSALLSTTLTVGKTLVFFSCCDSVDFHFQLLSHEDTPETVESPTPRSKRVNMLSTLLTASNIPLFKLHGSMEHSERVSILEEYRASSSSILLTTDVASRGLDIHDVARVVQYDLPNETCEYIHRSGRSGRMGRKGHVFVFVMPSEVGGDDHD